MTALARRHAAIFAIPMIIGLVTAQRAAPHVRAVDFILLFASGAIFGVSLMGLIQAWRSTRQSPRLGHCDVARPGVPVGAPLAPRTVRVPDSRMLSPRRE